MFDAKSETLALRAEYISVLRFIQTEIFFSLELRLGTDSKAVLMIISTEGLRSKLVNECKMIIRPISQMDYSTIGTRSQKYSWKFERVTRSRSMRSMETAEQSNILAWSLLN